MKWRLFKEENPVNYPSVIEVIWYDRDGNGPNIAFWHDDLLESRGYCWAPLGELADVLPPRPYQGPKPESITWYDETVIPSDGQCVLIEKIVGKPEIAYWEDEPSFGNMRRWAPWPL